MMADQHRKKKRPRDTNQLAKSIVDDVTSDADGDEEEQQKKPTAAEYGRQGGLIGGKKAADLLPFEFLNMR